MINNVAKETFQKLLLSYEGKSYLDIVLSLFLKMTLTL